MKQSEKENSGWEVFAFLGMNVGVHALYFFLEKCHQGMLLFLLCSPTLVFVCCGGSRWEDVSRLIFLSLSSGLQSEEALSPAICLLVLDIVIPTYRPVNISLVTAASLPQ